jgi:hypothetical protein
MKKTLVPPLACILSVSAFCYAQAPKPEAPKPGLRSKRYHNSWGYHWMRLTVHPRYLAARWAGA